MYLLRPLQTKHQRLSYPSLDPNLFRNILKTVQKLSRIFHVSHKNTHPVLSSSMKSMPLVQSGMLTFLTVDSITDPREQSTWGGEREIQRTMLELLNQLDGLDTRGDVKVIMATNKIESLDPALLRSGRIDCKVEFPLPDVKTKWHIFRFASTNLSCIFTHVH